MIGKFYQKGHFGHFRAATPFPDQMVDNISPVWLQPLLQKFLHPPMDVQAV